MSLFIHSVTSAAESSSVVGKLQGVSTVHPHVEDPTMGRILEVREWMNNNTLQMIFVVTVQAFGNEFLQISWKLLVWCFLIKEQ